MLYLATYAAFETLRGTALTRGPQRIGGAHAAISSLFHLLRWHANVSPASVPQDYARVQHGPAPGLDPSYHRLSGQTIAASATLSYVKIVRSRCRLRPRREGDAGRNQSCPCEPSSGSRSSCLSGMLLALVSPSLLIRAPQVNHDASALALAILEIT